MPDLALTSDFPSTASAAVVDLMTRRGARPRVAWIAPLSGEGRARFPAARQLFEFLGFPDLELCDIDEAPDAEQLALLDRYDVVYLSGGDPIAFRRNGLRVGLPARLRQCLAAGRLIVAASGGAMQLTPNVSLYRLLSQRLDDVFVDRAEYEASGLVGYEVLPHLNRFAPPFLEEVRRYSERIPHDILALADGAAVLDGGDGPRCFGRVTRLRRGVATVVEPAG